MEFKVGQRIYCWVTLRDFEKNKDMLTPGIYTIMEIKKDSSGDCYKLKEYINTDSFNCFHNSYFTSISQMRKWKLNKLNDV
jgi:hypothetical protein